MKKILIIGLLSLAASVKSQNRKVIPPSPETSSVFKFSEVPVSPYTGLASTTIPLYEIKLRDMTIPINLSYHGRGIKVEEMAPRVGLGWSLNYGGMLSTQIRGGRQDNPPTGPNPNADAIFTDANMQHELWEAILGALPGDLAPDKFMLDLNGLSVNFVIDAKSAMFLLQKYADIKIVAIAGTEAENYGIVGWIITDQHGNKFYYGKNKTKDRTAIDEDVTQGNWNFIFGGTSTSMDADNTPMRNTWHLMQIETVNHEDVEFYYEEELLTHYTRISDRKDRNNSNNTSGVILYTRSYYSKIQSQQYQIKKITFNGGQITFGKSPLGRQDVFGYNASIAPSDTDPRTLDTVSVYDNKNNVLKRYQFNYQYVTAAADPGNQLQALIDLEPPAAKRLYLTSVQEKGQNGETIPPTTFEYSPVALPNRFSNAQDAWGFFNGKFNGQYLTYFNDTGINPDRNIDTTKSEAGLLKKITLPSGGTTNFTYEQNRGQAPSYIDQLVTPDNTSTHPEGVSLIKNASNYTVNSNGDSCYQTPIHIGVKKVGTISFKMSMPYCSGTSTVSPCNTNYYLINLSGPKTMSFYRPKDSLTLDLPYGDYTLSVIPTSGDFNAADFNNTFFITMDWRELDTISGSSAGIRLAGGMRIKKVEYKNSNGTALVKTYKYQNENGSSSGQILGMPCYFWLIPLGEVTIASTVDNPGVYPMVDDLGAVPGAPLSNVQGNGIGYSRVEEYTGDETSNLGKTVYTYTNMEDAGDYWKFPYVYPTDNEWLRGRNLTTLYYKNSGAAYQLQKQIVNSYDYANTDSYNIFWKPFLTPDSPVYIHHIDRIKWYMPLIKVYEGVGLDGTSSVKQTFIYYQSGGTSNLTSSTETDYDANGNQQLKATNYYYDYNKHYNTSSTETTNSDGTTTLTHLSYAGSYPTGTAFIDTLRNRHILDVPIEQVNYKNNNGTNTILSGSITKYKTTTNGLVDQVLKLETLQPITLSSFKFSDRASSGVLPPAGTASVFSADTHYQPSVTFDSYDNQNNPLMLTPTQGQPVSYVWGYNQLYPIAEAKNARVNDIYHQNFEDTDGNSTDARTGQQCRTGGYSHTLTGLDAGSYIFSYWTKSSGVWTYQRTVVNVTGSSYALTLSGQIDDICFYPVTAQMSTYTYLQGVGMTSATDTKGITTFYEYDGFQRLVNVKDKDGNIVKHTDYHYANQ